MKRKADLGWGVRIARGNRMERGGHRLFFLFEKMLVGTFEGDKSLKGNARDAGRLN